MEGFLYGVLVSAIGVLCYIAYAYQQMNKRITAKEAKHNTENCDEYLFDSKLNEIDAEIMHASLNGLDSITVHCEPRRQGEMVAILKSLGYRVAKLDPNKEVFIISW